MLLRRSRIDAVQQALLHCLKLLLRQRTLLVERKNVAQLGNAALNGHSARSTDLCGLVAQRGARVVIRRRIGQLRQPAPDGLHARRAGCHWCTERTLETVTDRFSKIGIYAKACAFRPATAHRTSM